MTTHGDTPHISSGAYFPGDLPVANTGKKFEKIQGRVDIERRSHIYSKLKSSLQSIVVARELTRKAACIRRQKQERPKTDGAGFWFEQGA
jgi:hypothetical protein